MSTTCIRQRIDKERAQLKGRVMYPFPIHSSLPYLCRLLSHHSKIGARMSPHKQLGKRPMFVFHTLAGIVACFVS